MAGKGGSRWKRGQAEGRWRENEADRVQGMLWAAGCPHPTLKDHPRILSPAHNSGLFSPFNICSTKICSLMETVSWFSEDWQGVAGEEVAGVRHRNLPEHARPSHVPMSSNVWGIHED
jgi:hypothetical protein